MLRVAGIVLLLALACVRALAAPVDEAQLAKPPADAQKWLIVSNAGQHGWSARWTDKAGVRWSRESLALRGFKTEIDQQEKLTPDGYVFSHDVRGYSPQGDAAESFEIANGRYRFTSPVDKGEGAARHDLLYASFSGTLDATISLFDTVLHAPDRTAELLPSGRLTMEPLTKASVTQNGKTRQLTAYAVTGFSFAPFAVWYDGDTFFALIGTLSYIPDGWTAVVPQLSKVQDDALAARAPVLLARVAKRPVGAVVFRNVQIYDAVARQFRPNMSVVANAGRIVAVGPASSVAVPDGAQVFDGAGKTLIPGLWDNHLHYGDDSTGPLLLAQGITSVRDPGNRPEESTARRKRIEAGELLGPRIVPSLIIDGPGERSAQAAVIVKTEAEAIAAVRRAKAEGYFAIKLYGSLSPVFVKPMADEAHRLGLRVHGHLPAGMRPLEAVRAGYDEITHIYFVMMQAMPDAVVRDSNGEQRIFGPGRYAADVDLNSNEMRAFLDELQRRGTAVDPTLVVVETLFLGERGKLAPAYAPLVGTLPPQIERGFKGGGLTPPADLSRARLQQSFAKLQALVLELKRRGLPILAGTDGLGIELVRELELYVQAGMTPAEALASATIIPANTFHVGSETGSIEVGKRAELVLINGDPSKDIGELRQVEIVLEGERLMSAQDLRGSIGISGPAHRAH